MGSAWTARLRQQGGLRLRLVSEYRDLDQYDEEFLEYFIPYVRDSQSLETIRQMLFTGRLQDQVPGMPAAIAAARGGVKVILIEEDMMPGGAAAGCRKYRAGGRGRGGDGG